MAYRICSNDQLLSDGSLYTVTNTPTIHASTNITIGTSSIYTATYTATAGGEAVNGCMIWMDLAGYGGAITITHQEDSGAGFADTSATATINIADMPDEDNGVFFKFAVPFVYTTSTANKQRFRIVASSPLGTTRAAADSGGANVHFKASSDITGAVALGEDVDIINENCSGTATLTMDGTHSFGSGTNTVRPNERQLGNAITIYSGGIMSDDIVADSDITHKGNIVVYPGAQWICASEGTPLPQDVTVKYQFDQNGVKCNYNIVYINGSIISRYGNPIPNWKNGFYSSGVGTATSPVVLTGTTDFNVGDKLIFNASSDNSTNYNESETKYIITKVSSTTYVLADTAGGTQSALSYSHTGARVVNATKNIIQTTTNSSYSFSIFNYNTTKGNEIQNWVEFNTVGTNTKSFCGGIFASYVDGYGNWDYCSITNSLYQSWILNSSKNVETFEGLMVYDSGSLTSTAASALYVSGGSAKKTLNNYWVTNTERSILYMTSGNTITFNDGVFNCVNRDGASVAAGLYMNGGTAIEWNDCEWNATRYPLALGSAQMEFNTCTVGTKGKNNYDVNLVTDAYTICTFRNCTLDSGTGVYNYLNSAEGAEVAFDTLDLVTNKHIWYNNKGTGQATGAGLPDTTVRTTDTLNVGMYAENLDDGFVYEYEVLAKPGNAVQTLGFIYENATFVADGDASIKVELFLPNSSTADASQMMTLTTDDMSTDAVYNISASYTGTVYRYATVKITVKTEISGAYAYLADVNNGNNDITNLNTWEDGKPSKIMFAQLGDPNAVWSVATSTMTTAGTIGKLVVFMDKIIKNLRIFR